MPADRKVPRTPSKPYDRPSSSPSPSLASSSDFELITPSKSLVSRQSMARSPVSSGSEDNDRSSDFQPGVAEEDEDFRPDASDADEVNPRKGKKAKAPVGAARQRAQATPRSKPRVTPTKNTSARAAGGGGAKGSAYTAEEDWALFERLRPRVSVNWNEVSRDVGRDTTSCKNRWPILNKKVEAFIRGNGA